MWRLNIELSPKTTLCTTEIFEKYLYVTELVKPNLVGYFSQPGEILANLGPGQFRKKNLVKFWWTWWKTKPPLRPGGILRKN